MEEYDLELDWRGFELHPDTPPGGIPLGEYFPPDRIEAMREHLPLVAAHFGVEGMQFPQRLQNSRRALRLGELARDERRLDLFRQLAMDAYWMEGKNLEDDEVLLGVANAAGLSRGALERADTQPEYSRRIDEIRHEAGEIGVTGIPTFVIGQFGVVGCQPYEVLEQLAVRAGVSRRAE